MANATTRQRLLESAERLMALNGITETSVREVTEDAGANIAAINYYFGGKDELIFQLLKNGFEQLDTTLLEKLSALEASRSNGHGRPSLSEIVAVYFDTLLDLGVDPATGRPDPFIELMQHAASQCEAILERAQDYEAPGITKFVDMAGATADPPLSLRTEIETFVGLIFDPTVSAMRVAAVRGRNAASVDAIRAFASTGAEGYLAALASDAEGPTASD